MMRGMVIDMKDEQLHTLAQLQAFVDGTVAVDFAVTGEERYGFIARTIRRFGYARLKRPDKGVVLRFLGRVSGYSRQQLTRLVQRVRSQAPLLKRYRASRTSFARTFSNADVLLLAHTDTLHGTLSGLATKKLMERAFRVFGETRYERLATISVAHLYNLRKRNGYLRHRQVWTKTRPVTIAIGQRRAPAPNNRPGYLRIDTVHQGDQEGVKGLYHINAVDQVTQWQVVGATPHISEAWLLPLLESMLEQFPFRIRGFHSDNGSEFINYQVSGLLNKLLIEQTKSRPRHSGDNALVESKNGAVIRKHLGWTHIASQHADAVNQFHRQHLNPYLNFHRPCGIAELRTLARGKIKRVYRQWETPWDILRGLPDWETSLRAETNAEALQTQASAHSDTDA